MLAPNILLCKRHSKLKKNDIHLKHGIIFKEEKYMVHIDKHILIDTIKQHAYGKSRILVAIVGAPASGKSTLAESLQHALGENSCVLPMDGFHLDNTILKNRGIFHRKGAPYTFDVTGFTQLVKNIKQTTGDIFHPTFDRSKDRVIPDSACISSTAKYIIAEGNYLLLNTNGWADVIDLWDISVYLQVPEHILYSRLIGRWLYYGLSHTDAVKRAESNDLKNVKTIIKDSAPADYTLVLSK